MQHDHFLNSTGDIGIDKRQSNATLAFRKINKSWGPPVRGPSMQLNYLNTQITQFLQMPYLLHVLVGVHCVPCRRGDEPQNLLLLALSKVTSFAAVFYSNDSSS